MKQALRKLPMLVLVGCMLAGTAHVAHATIQDDSCIEPDIEYPVPCDDED
jgi:hypothetical protein